MNYRSASVKAIGLWCVMIILLIAFAAEAGVQLESTDSGRKTQLAIGDVLTITLSSNPTTGFQWEVAPSKSSVLELIEEPEYTPSDTRGPPLLQGSGGTIVFRFIAVRSGQMVLELIYRRPWEKDVKPDSVFTTEVVVR